MGTSPVSVYLAFDTATDVGSVALGEPGRVAAELRFTDRRHAAALMPAAEELLRLAGAAYADLAGVVVADGPGSFTGLRIAFATAKGLLEARDGLALWTAPSLMAAACAAAPFQSGPIAALYDALRGDVFAAVYEFGAETVRVHLEPTRGPPDTLDDRCPVRPGLAVGDGALVYREAVRRWTGREPVPPPAGSPSAAALLALLAIPGAARRVEDPVAFEPAYGRVAEAQARWERKHGRPLPDPGGHQR